MKYNGNGEPPNGLAERDALARARLADRLLTKGVAVGGKPRRVELFAGDPSAFVVRGRVIVPTAQANEASALINGDIEELGGANVAVIDVGDDGDTPQSLIRRLDAHGLTASPEHVLMSAGRTQIKEGEDAEFAEEPKPRQPKLHTNACVVVIDTGLDVRAPESGWFDGVVIDVDNTDPMYDRAPLLGHGGGHGTFVSGVVRQLAPLCDLRMIRALDVHGVGAESEIAAAIVRAAALKPQVLLCAFGGYTFDNQPPLALQRAMGLLTETTLVVAAGGNERESLRPLWPACMRGVRAIGAVESELDGDLSRDSLDRARLCWFSNTGPTIEYAAAGRWTSAFGHGDENPLHENDDHADTFYGWAQAAGTSMAAAAVAGAVAALCGSGVAPADAWDQLRGTAVPIRGSKLLALDVWKLLA